MTSVWDDVVGQPDAVAVLRRAVTDPSSMTHAWLVTGPPGSGRSVAARAFAAALVAGDGGRWTSEVADNARARVMRGTHPDVHVVATDKTVITVAEVRDLVTIAQRTPGEAPWRVIVVEDADRIVERSANALLKAIEEPPPRTVWILCAPSEQDVITTIRSRCRHVTLRVPPADAVADLLVRRHGIDRDDALVAARAAQSHIGLATSLALNAEARARRDRVLEIASRVRGVGDAVIAAGELVEVATAQASASMAERDAVEKAALLRSLGADNAEGGKTLPANVRTQIRQLEDDQKRRGKRAVVDGLDRAMTDLLSFYRDVLAVQVGSDVDLVNAAQVADVRAVAAASDPQQTLRRTEAIATARTRLAGNVAPLLAVEAMTVALRPQG
ncbi:DNA polymerase III subunit delta' [Serinibacter arcticus]|uniref:DNA polymerase III delta prime subunit n=1 Tax=Serinibacter arcticus TaxID=1655435 RepID=A0A4Z1EAN5_9MICO|nr:DNA polymerase III subunit delta' [Serinibacter arcticus]TGO06527.1 DNA polymerase III delta prime subunit [Serinibacter arcticus]